jgi:hypothetical protein
MIWEFGPALSVLLVSPKTRLADSTAARLSLGPIPGDARMGEKAAGSPLRHNSHVGDFEARDGQAGDWSRESLIEMDRQFCERVERALRHGLESRRHGRRRPRALPGTLRGGVVSFDRGCSER